MKNSKPQILFIVLALAMAVSALFTGCQQEATQTEATKTPEPTATTAPAEVTPAATEVDPFAEHMDIRWIVYNQPDYYPVSGSPVQTLIEETYNVTLDIVELDVFSEDEWTLFWASGGMADKIQSNTMSKYIYEFADQEIIRPIDYDWLYEYAPGTMEIILSLVDEEYIKQSTLYKDQLWCLPNTAGASPFLAHIMYIRKSWMDQVGVESAPTTMDEYYDLVKKFTHEDPDNNGADDTYGICWHSGSKMQQFYYFWGAMGIGVNTFNQNDGVVTYTGIDPKFKDALKVLAQWYAEGIIDPEFITEDRTSQRAKWSAGKFGILEDSPWWFSQTTNNNLTDMLLANFPDEELVAVGPFTGPDGQSGAAASLPDLINTATYFGVEASDEKVQRIMAIEEAKSGWDWYARLYYGVEGQEFTYDENGIIVVNPDIEVTSEYILENGIRQTFGIAPRNVEMYMKTVPAADQDNYMIALSSPLMITARYGEFARDFAAGQNTALAEKGEDMTSVFTEFVINAITGAVDIDAEWDAYVQSMKDNGLDEVIAEYEASLAQ